ncbi:hypothetical protein [Nostoc sp. 'Peltigera membranacea cyanobiont' 210A]|nr:hypothetical protein [Nostoc sp. 'Peltigera membranacea cyanobiont' 210A]
MQDDLLPLLLIDWQIKRSPVSLIAHHKITALLAPLPHAKWVMLNGAISV